MNTDWIDFLKSNHAVMTENSAITLPHYPQNEADFVTAVANLATITVSGQDAALFLQGQLTCNIDELTESNSFFSAFCNAKGRTISTLLVLKNAASFLIILPNELVETVITKLRMYILRADVQLSDTSDELCLIGLNTKQPKLLATNLPTSNFSVVNGSKIIIKFPSQVNRYLLISPYSQASALWAQLTQESQVFVAHSATWAYQDISAGIAWLTLETSETYIPQMLNIDKLGGISFNKGCYIGQEIVARTHYLGQAKRALFLAETNNTIIVDKHSYITAENQQQAKGKIISMQANDINCRMLIVMTSSDIELKNLRLNNSNQTGISIINFQ